MARITTKIDARPSDTDWTPKSPATEGTLSEIEKAFDTEGKALGSGVLIQGDDGTDRTNVLVDTAGHLQVDVLSGGGAGTEYTEGDTDATITGTAILWEDTSDTLRAVSASKPLPISDAGGTLTVDGTVTANLAAGSNNIGDVDVLTLPASTNTIEVVGDAAENAVAAGNPVLVGGRYDVAGRTLGDTDVGAIALDSDGAVHIADGGNVITVDGTVTANLSATDNTVLDNIDSNTDYGAVVGGGAEATALRVTIANDSTGVLTVDGTVTANLGATDNAVLDAIALGYATEGDALGDGVLIQGDDGTDRTNVLVDAAGHLQVDVLSGGGAGTQYTEDEATANPQVGGAIMVERDDALSSVTPIEGDWIGLRGTAEGALWTQDFNSDAILVDTTAIKTAIQLLDDAVDGNYLNVNLNIAGTDVGDGAAAVAIKDGGNTITVDGTVTETNSADIETAVQLIDDAIYADDADWTGDTSKHMLVGGVYGANTITDGDVGPISLAADGAVHIDDGGNTITVDGTVTANLGDTDNAVLDNIALYTSGSETALEKLDDAVDGNYLNVNLNMAGTDAAAGEGTISAQTQRVTIATDDDAVTDIGALESATDSSTMWADAAEVTVKRVAISAASSGDNTLVAAVAAKNIRVISLFIVATAEVAARFESGAGGTALSGVMTITDHSGLVLPYNPKGWFETADNTLLNLELGGAVQVSGSLQYIEV